MSKARVLVVEDEAIVAMETAKSLQNLGYEVISTVNSGDVAIKKAEDENPDIILMDIRIQGDKDGIETAEIIRNKYGIPVIYTTAYSDDERIERAKQTIPFGYIIKPTQERDLKVTLEMALYVSRVESERIKTNLKLKESEKQLKERLKELSCMYQIASLIERFGNDIEKILKGTLEIIPSSWQYPEITKAKVVVEEHEYMTEGYTDSKWNQKSDILINGSKAGYIEVCYLEEKLEIDEDVFLKEERLLIDAIAERLGRACERVGIADQLKTEQEALKNKNIALHEVLSKINEEKQDIKNSINSNVDKIILPIIYDLENQFPQGNQKNLQLLKSSLTEITSPFINKISNAVLSLTPTELQICNMIKSGLKTKEISKLRHISSSTVNRHRERIRKKLGITNEDINLATYLMSIS